MNNVIDLKGAREAPKNLRSGMETLILTVAQTESWQLPSFQRELKVNAKVEEVAHQIKESEVIPGIITLGTVGKSSTIWLVDGQHRVKCFWMSGLPEAIADVRLVHFDSTAEMAEEFVRLNSALRKMSPDDILRGLEEVSPNLQHIRRECGYVGYDHVRHRGSSGPIVGMSQLLRNWYGSLNETPAVSTGRGAAQIAMDMDEPSTRDLVRFMGLAYSAWGREPEYFRLWGGLNITMCMWLFRKLVLDTHRGVKRYIVLKDPQFRQCLMSLTADNQYLDWLPGHHMGERDRSPCYAHLRRIFAKRLIAEGIDKPQLPTAAWFARTA